MSKINLALELNPETPFTQGQADAVASLVYAFSSGEKKQTVITDKVETDATTVKEEAPVKEEKTTTTRTRGANKTQTKKEEAPVVEEEEKPTEEVAETEADNSGDIEAIRSDLKLSVGKKVEKHRETIKAEITRLGFDNMPKLMAGASYEVLKDFNSFVNKLA